MAQFLAVFLVFCGFGITADAAKPRLSTDEITAVSPLTLKQVGPARWAGIELLEKAKITPGPVQVKKLGQDRYGHAQVVLYRPGAKQSMQEELLSMGRAVLQDRTASPAAWKKAEASARAGGRGIWNNPDAILVPAKAGEAMGTFRFVQGKVTRTYQGRDMWWINFGEDWKTDFSLRIPKRAWRSFGKDFAIADGACLRARGTIFHDNGPAIELTRPEQLEMLHANACRG